MWMKLIRTGTSACLAWFLLFATAAHLPGQFKRVSPSQQDRQDNYPAQNTFDLSADPAAGEQFDAADAQHGVARLSLAIGEVNVQRTGSAGVVAAAINAPLFANDRVQTGERSSAEIQLDAATVIRLAEDTDLGFGIFEAGRFQAQIGAGTVIYRVLGPNQLAGELDTPNIAIRPLGAAELRVSVLGGGTTRIDVRSGDAEIAGPAGTEHLAAGHAYEVRGGAADPEFQETEPASVDGFENWSANRDQELSSSQSAQYLGPDVPGAADLDANGSWVPSSEYGQVWEPSGVAANWTPYSDGQWAYQDYYGWTWVDRASWGWTPYHYGRWFNNGSYGWCWWPGDRLAAHSWRPAVVGFFGWGGGYRGLGWAPLAPGEPFRPWWGNRARAFGYNGRSILATYRNAGFRGGAVFASYNNFAGPGQRFSHLSRQQLRGAAVLGGRVPLVPTRGSYRFSERQAFSIGRSANYGRQSFVSSERVGGFSSRPRDAGGSSGWSRMGSYSRQSLSATPRQSTPARDSGSRWQRFGDPGGSFNSSGAYRQRSGGNSYTENDSSGWHQFGRPVPPAASRQRDNSPSSGRQQQRTPRDNAPRRFSAPSGAGRQRQGGQGGGGNRGSGNRGGGRGHGNR